MAIEVERVLSDLYPLLRTVRPAQLNYTLTALADALEGRGETAGENLVVLDDYLRRMNPKIPLLVDDLGKLATVSDTYRGGGAGAGERVAQQREDGEHVRGEGGEGPGVVRRRGRVLAHQQGLPGANGHNIIRLSRQGQAQLPLFAKYAPEYPCLLEGMVNQTPRLPAAVPGLHPPHQPRAAPEQPHRLHDRRHPEVRRAQRPALRAAARTRRTPAEPHPAARRSTPSTTASPVATASSARAPRPASTLTSGYAGTASERALVEHARRPRDGSPGRRGARRRLPAVRAAGPRGGGERAMKLLDKRTRSTPSSC